MKPSAIILSVAGFIIVSLLSGNLYFISRTINQIDEIERNTWGLKQEVLILKLTFDNHNHKK